jgi:hypothetical protein
MAYELSFDAAPFAAALERVTVEVAQELQALATQHATNLARQVRKSYPVGKTGNLVGGVTSGELSPRRPTRIGAWVKSNAPHVHFLEAGTHKRYNVTRKRAYRGFVPFGGSVGGRTGASQIFVPLAVAERSTFFRDVETVLLRDRVVG